MADDQFLTVSEAAAMLRVEPKTVRRWLRGGRLNGIFLGSRRAGWRIPRSEVRRILGLEDVRSAGSHDPSDR